MPLTATQIDGGQSGRHRASLTRTEAGFEGVRWFTVDTSSAADALTAAGLPAIGDPFGPQAPFCVARQIGPAEVWGGKPNGTNPGGMCVVPVRYSSGLGTLALRPRSVTDKWATLEFGGESVQVRHALGVYAMTPTGGRGALWPDQAVPIAAGDGVAKDVGLLTVRVAVHQAVGAAIDVPRLATLTSKQALNDASVTTPALERVGPPLTFAAGQLRYTGAKIAVVDGVLQIEHTMLARPDHDVRWSTNTDDGREKDRLIGPIYEQESFAGLW